MHAWQILLLSDHDLPLTYRQWLMISYESVHPNRFTSEDCVLLVWRMNAHGHGIPGCSFNMSFCRHQLRSVGLM